MKYAFAMIVCTFAFATTAFCSGTCAETGYGKCFNIHARYRVYTGDGMEVLWPVGTHRLLWAASGTDQLDNIFTGHFDDSDIFGDFVVCPLTKEVSGEMRHVCIKGMSNLRRIKRKQ